MEWFTNLTQSTDKPTRSANALITLHLYFFRSLTLQLYKCTMYKIWLANKFRIALRAKRIRAKLKNKIISTHTKKFWTSRLTDGWGIGCRFFLKNVRFLKHNLRHENVLQSQWLINTKLFAVYESDSMVFLFLLYL